MKKIKQQQIAIFRALQLGDMICAIPAFRALRQAYPHAYITLIGLPWAKEFVKRFNTFIDDFITFPGYPGLPEQSYTAKDFATFMQTVRKKRFDLLLQMHGDGSVVNPLMYQLNAKRVAGFYPKDSACPDPKMFFAYPQRVKNKDYDNYQLKMFSEKETLLKLMEFLHIPVSDKSLEFPITKREKEKLLLSPLFQKICNTQYICIHPGARDLHRRWNPTYFAFVADALAQRGFSVALTGTKEEIPVAKRVASLMQYPSVNFAGKTDLGSLAALLSYAQLVITNCTGVAHVADALNIPSVVVYLASDPVQWGSANKRLHRQVLQEKSGTPYFVLREALDLLYKDTLSHEVRYNLMQKEGKAYES